MKKQLLLFVTFLLPLVASAYDIAVKNADGQKIYYNWINNNTELEVTYESNNNYYSGSIVIPDIVEYDGQSYSVTSIGNYAFSRCSDLTSITIPNSVKYINSYAFYYCYNLPSITIPNSVTAIGIYAFSGCTHLTSIIFPNSVTTIDTYAFAYCKRLTSITFPNSITNIGTCAFMDCEELTSISIPNSVTTMGDWVFFGCNNLTLVTLNSTEFLYQGSTMENVFGEQVTTYILGESITHIKKFAFSGCKQLQNVIFPTSLKSIGTNAFSGCSGLTKVIVNNIAGWYNISFENDLSNPLYYAHHLYSDENTEITDLIIPDGMTSINNYIFSGWSALTSVTIPNSVTSIGKSAFYGCSGLTSVSIPNSVTAIENSAFSKCSSLTSVTIPNSVTSIDSYVFEGCSNLIFVEIPNSVTAIGEAVFRNCSNLTSIKIPNSVTSIGYYVFRGCSKLASVFIGDNVSYIGNSVFEDNSKLYVKNHTISLIALWNSGYKPYLIGTETILEPPYLTAETTQTTATLKINNYYDRATYLYNSQPITGDETTITGLFPDTSTSSYIGISLGEGKTYSNILKVDFKTQPISPTIEVISTASSIRANASYIEGDAEVVSQRLVLNPSSVSNSKIYGGTDLEGLTYFETGLDPNTYSSNSFAYEIKVSNGKTTKSYHTEKITAKTDALTLTTQQPKVVSVGNVIVAAESNLDDEETNVGFEWRRTDWSDDFNSNTGGAYLYEGMMEGYIRNLYTEKLWKYRPYYTSNSGKTYYGDWVGIDPTNTSYFEPTVHTYANVDVSEGTATLNGYVMVGTDNITEQGFEYWIAAESNSPSSRAQQDVQTITATGTRMSATLTGLQNNATYVFRAFAKTTSGTTYGEERSFKTPSVTGIELVSTPSICSTAFNVYTLSGAMVRHKTTSFEGLPRGLYIVNGKKVVIK